VLLPAPFGAQQREYLAVIDGEGQVIDRNDVAVGLAQVPDFHGSHCVHLLVNLDVAPACVWERPR
jgi:hypothetical protein